MKDANMIAQTSPQGYHGRPGAGTITIPSCISSYVAGTQVWKDWMDVRGRMEGSPDPRRRADSHRRRLVPVEESEKGPGGLVPRPELTHTAGAAGNSARSPESNSALRGHKQNRVRKHGS